MVDLVDRLKPQTTSQDDKLLSRTPPTKLRYAKGQNILAFVILFLVFSGTALMAVFSQTSVQAPLLTKPVTLDGRTTDAVEWSDTTENPIAMYTRDGSEKKDATIRAKHDEEWLYLLLRVERLSSDNAQDNCGIYYHWGPGAIGTQGKTSDAGQVNKRGIAGDFYGYDGSRWLNDVDDGGTNDVEGTITQDDSYMWCEFRKKLNSGDARHDWSMSAGNTYGGTDEQLFAGVLDANTKTPYTAALALSILENPITPTATTTTPTTPGEPRQTPIGVFALVGLVAVLVVASFMIVKRRRKPAAIPVQETESAVAEQEAPRPIEVPVPSGPSVSTGYTDLDAVLAGGLPEGYAVLLVSPSCDERDLLLRRVVESCVSSARPTFYVSGDLGRTRDLASQFQKDFYAFCPHADRLAAPNVYGLPRVENLSDFNIVLSKTITDRGLEKAPDKMLILDIVSEVLLQHKSLTTRKWLADFVDKRKAQGFTILATLNPLITSREEAHTVIDFFDGIIEIYERELKERSRRFLIVKKMYGRRYVETELLLDKEKLFKPASGSTEE
mgnify:CR=1 FL=1